jgi:beta-ribofuranosylaminobenzene 5'-phosphate synthase
MTRIRIQTPSRLHFGLLGWGTEAHRQFGGAGLMVAEPGIELTAESARDWSAEGPLADRALETAHRIVARRGHSGTPLNAVHLKIVRAPEEHVGLGVGTQLSLAVARAVLAVNGWEDPPLATLAVLSGRGLRSGVGVHGFALGGLIVDGGRKNDDGIPPLLAHVDLPDDWSVLLVTAGRGGRLHGSAERQAFARLPATQASTTDRLCRLVLLGLLPAVAERDLASFGSALSEMQQHVGRSFSPAQGGVFADPEVGVLASHLRSLGLHGVGQSSWGPTLYAFTGAPRDEREAMLRELRQRFALDPNAACWTLPSPRGALLEIERS